MSAAPMRRASASGEVRRARRARAARAQCRIAKPLRLAAPVGDPRDLHVRRRARRAARGAPRRSARRRPARSPSTSATTLPSRSFRTQPATPSRRASSCIEPRYQTPCTRPRIVEVRAHRHQSPSSPDENASSSSRATPSFSAFVSFEPASRADDDVVGLLADARRRRGRRAPRSAAAPPGASCDARPPVEHELLARRAARRGGRSAPARRRPRAGASTSCRFCGSSKNCRMLAATSGPTSRTSCSCLDVASTTASSVPKCSASALAVASPTCRMPSAVRRRGSVVFLLRSICASRFVRRLLAHALEVDERLRGRAR